MPGWVCVADVPVWDPMPGLGVTVPVFCAAAMPIDSANTDVANRIFRIEDAPSLTSAAKAFCTRREDISL